MSPGKWRPFCLCLNVLIRISREATLSEKGNIDKYQNTTKHTKGT